MNDFLRRKSLPGRVIHRLRPRGPHPARRPIRHCDAMVRQAGAPNEDNERHSAGIRAAGTHYPTRQLVRDQPVRHFHVFVETSRRSGRARRTGVAGSESPCRPARTTSPHSIQPPLRWALSALGEGRSGGFGYSARHDRKHGGAARLARARKGGLGFAVQSDWLGVLRRTGNSCCRTR